MKLRPSLSLQKPHKLHENPKKYYFQGCFM